MKIRIKETSIIEELTFHKNGIDHIEDIIAPASRDEFTWNINDDIWEISAEDFEWWNNYISQYESDEEELDSLLSILSELGFVPDEIKEEIVEAINGIDMDYQHEAFQSAIKSAREIYCMEEKR